MLDPAFIREHPDEVRDGLQRRGMDPGALDAFLEADAERRRLLQQAEGLKQQRNQATDEIARRKRQGEDAAEQIAANKRLSEEIKGLDQQVAAAEERLRPILLTLPNLPHPSVPPGAGAADNPVVRSWGEPRGFDFEARDHVTLGEGLGILDFARAAKIAGARFAVSLGAGARLERALIQFMLDLHVREHGYLEVLPPFLVNREAMTGTGQLPKFEADLFRVADVDLFLIPTAEVPVTNLHRDEILEPGTLPRKYVSYTPCFRSEAGSYGKDTRGLIRQHQFNKVELVKFCAPESSDDELEGLTADAEVVLRRLELPYRVVDLCGGDLGFSARRTYDLEVWIPSQAAYREISSCSSFGDFQARRAGIKYRPETGARARHVHTLNGSGLAVGRTVVALLENYQEADGTVTLPAALHPYMDGLRRIAPDR